jgi:CRP-like cAMP-binding protein
MTFTNSARSAARAAPGSISDNELLACLPIAARRPWEPHAEFVALERGEPIHESASRPYAYFPVTAVIAQLCLLKDGASAESALIGNEGMIGFPLVLGGESTPSRAVVLISGDAWRVEADFLRMEVQRVIPVMHLMLRFLQAMMTQMAQTAVCNRHHSIDEQLCRWLLQVIDRLPAGEFAMTRELMALMLGVSRESINEAAGTLQLAGLIRFVHGQVTVLSRTGLERRACECYSVVQREYARLLPHRLAT